MIVVGINQGATKDAKPLRDGGCAAIIEGNVVAAISEERVNRVKHSGGFHASLDKILKHLNLRYSDIDLIVTSSCCEDQIQNLSELELFGLRAISCDHHLSHAYCAFMPSDFEEAIVIVIDAGGNTLDLNAEQPWWYRKREQHSYYKASRKAIELISRDFTEPEEAGIGEVFRAFTYYLGWPSSTFAGNTMALAGCCQNSPFAKFRIFDAKDKKMFSIVKNNPPEPIKMVNSLLDTYNIPRCPRMSGKPIRKPHIYLAKWVQSELERALVKIVDNLILETGIENVCLAGGVGYNCKAIRSVIRNSKAKKVFVSPTAGDQGQALGNAYYGYLNFAKEPKLIKLSTQYLGPSADSGHGTIKRLIKQLRLPMTVHYSNDIAKDAARLLSDNLIIAWFQGRSEFGPRALGNRSILASANIIGINKRLNTIKRRETFMPFAPAVLEEDAIKYFEDGGTPYMTIAVEMKPIKVPWAKNVLHKDGSARIQVVGKESNPLFHRVISNYKLLTGIPVVLNTSFNNRGEPIVETVADALECYYKLDIDNLIVGNSIVRKSTGERTLTIKVNKKICNDIAYNEIDRTIKTCIKDEAGYKRNRFLLNKAFMGWVREGRKKTTIRFRKGGYDYPEDISLPLLETDDYGNSYTKVIGRAVIKQIEIKRFVNLNNDDAYNDGFLDEEELKKTLKKIYHNLSDNDFVTIYHVEIVE